MISTLDARYRSSAWARLRALFFRKKELFHLTEDIDSNSKQLKEKFNHIQMKNNINNCPVSR